MNTIQIADIRIGERRREDLGDIEALAESIRKYGLLSPPVLTDDGTLVVGQRRIEAMKLLGWTETPYIDKGQLTQARLHEIELEENIRRKDFTEYEISKNMVALAEVVGKRLVAEAETCPTVGQVGKRGPQAKVDGIRAISDAIGIPRSTVQHARDHVAAVETHPILESIPKMAAIGIAKRAAQLPEEQRERFVSEQANSLRRDFKQIDDAAALARKFINALGIVRTIEISRENVETWVKFEKMDLEEIGEARGDIRECVRRFLEIDKILAEMTTLRAVK